MHAILVTFRSSTDPDALAGVFARHAEALQGVPGLVMKTWLRDGEALGGFHLFATREAAEEFLASDLAAELPSALAVSGYAVRHFTILGELSHATGTPRPVGG